MTHVLAMETDDVLTTRGYVQFMYPGGPLPDGVSSYGKAGWEVVLANGLRTLTKQGTMGGFSSTVALVPDLKLGIYVWDNGQVSSTMISAHSTQLLVQHILTLLSERQTKPACPAVNDIVGEYYSSETQMEFKLQIAAPTPFANMLDGSIGGTPYWFEYDKKTTDAAGETDTYFFRYFMIADDPDYSCINLGMGGIDNGLIRFKKNDQGKWEALRFDTWTRATKKE